MCQIFPFSVSNWRMRRTRKQVSPRVVGETFHAKKSYQESRRESWIGLYALLPARLYLFRFFTRVACSSVKGTGGRLFLQFIGTWFADTVGGWCCYTIFCFPRRRYDVNDRYQITAKQVSRIRGTEKLKIDVTHRYLRTGYQRTENKVIRRSAIKRLKVLPKVRQSAVKKVVEGNRLFTVKSRFFPTFHFSPG